MSKSLELSDSVFAALEEAATASGTTPAEWIAANLPPTSVADVDGEGVPPGTLAERLVGLVGLIRSGRSVPSERYDGMFADAGEGLGAAPTGVNQRVIQVSEDVYRDLELESRALGTTPGEWIAARLPHRSPRTEPNGGAQPPRTLADEFAGRVGRLASGRSDLSERASESFADAMIEKRRAGRL